MNTTGLFSVEAKKAIVTGAARGIGKVLALALADAGCDVSIIEIDMDGAEKVAKDIRNTGRNALAIKADVTVASEVKQAFTQTAREFNGLDICINNAGIGMHEAAEEIPEEHFDRMIGVNLKGVFLCCQEAGKILIPRRKGSIINIASMSGSVANYPQKQAHYNVSKAGVVLLTKCLAVEWAPYGIRVNSLSPGYTRTEMTAINKRLIPEWESLIPMGRMADPKELVGAVIYLASDASSYTTGSDIIVDGGYTAR